MPEFQSRWLSEKPRETVKYSFHKTNRRAFEGSVERIAEGAEQFSACSHCGRPLRLPESQALRLCGGCQSEAQWIDSLARMALRRERTNAAVAARLQQLRMDGAA